MPRQFLTSIDLAKSELQNAVVHQLAAPPGSPARGQLYFNTGDNTLYYCDNPTTPTWVAAKSGAPTAHAASHNFGGGDAIAANGAVGTPTLRKLGTAATDAAPGDHGHGLADAAITGTLPVSKGGTGSVGGLAVGGLIYGFSTSAMGTTAAGTAGQLLQSAGASAPSWISRFSIRLDEWGTPTGPVSMNAQKLSGLADGTVGTDAVNKSQLDTAVQGLDAKGSVRVATTANNNLSGPQTIDGVVLANGDRVLAKNQTTTSQNGIYTVNTGGSWGRASDMDNWAEVPSAFTWVEQGSLNADTGWVCTTTGAGTIGTNPITWTQFSGAGQISAGAGMTKTGSQLDVGAGTGITVAVDSVAVDTGVIATVASLASYVPTTRTITPTAPLTGGGALSGNLTLDISNFTTSVKGAVPPPGSATGKFLKDDATWASPPAGTVQKYSLATVGGATSQVITHGLGSKDVIVQLYRNASPYDQVECDVEHTSTTTVTLRFAVAPAASAYSVVVTG